MQTQNTNQAIRSNGPSLLFGPAPRNQAEYDCALAETVVLQVENKDAFLRLLARLRDEYLPNGCTERHFVENIAISQWHQQRMAMVIRTILDREGLLEIKGISDHSALRLFKSSDQVETRFLCGPEGCGVLAIDPENHLARSTEALQIGTHKMQRS
jgi:hypothetical protein